MLVFGCLKRCILGHLPYFAVCLTFLTSIGLDSVFLLELDVVLRCAWFSICLLCDRLWCIPFDYTYFLVTFIQIHHSRFSDTSFSGNYVAMNIGPYFFHCTFSTLVHSPNADGIKETDWPMKRKDCKQIIKKKGGGVVKKRQKL